jgi:multiple sugar transport system substrate-binding protein
MNDEKTSSGITTLKGLSWGHRRATHPLYAATATFSRENPQLSIQWDDRPLSGFVNEEMADVVGRYDLISFDHPFSGTVVSDKLFVALNERLPHLLGQGGEMLYVGPSLASYRYGGTIIGAPVDAAVQHGIYRADLLEALGESVPQSWSDALALGRRIASQGKFLAAAFANPHAFLTLASLCANLGKPLPDDPRDGAVLDRDVAATALDALRELFSLTPPNAISWDSIAMHDAMSRTDEAVFCPCEFGYATYGESDQPHRLSFCDFAGLQAPYVNGGILGGVGLGIPVASRRADDALRFVEYALRPDTQRDLFAMHHGQPALRAVWQDEVVDERFNRFFSSVRKTIDHAAIRPRFPGYIHSQVKAGQAVEDFLRDHKPVSATIDALVRIFEQDAARLGTR